MEKYKSAKKVGIYGILGNIFLLCIKSIFGIISHSHAMMADAANSAGDILASIFTFVGSKISSEPSDDDHNMGHGKAEYVFSLFISISMVILAIRIVTSSIASIINQEKLTFSFLLLIVCIVTIIVKVFLYIYSRKVYQVDHSILVKANMKDHRNDCVITSITLVSIYLSKLGIYWLDGIVGIGISIWIFYTGYQILVESYNVLMDISIDDISKEKIIKIVNKNKDIIKMGTISTIPIGSKFIVVLTICVDGKMSTTDSHQITLDIAQKITRNIPTVDRAIIHVNPYKIEEDNIK